MKSKAEFLTKEELDRFRNSNSAFKNAESELAYNTAQLSSFQSKQKSSLVNYENKRHDIDEVTEALVSKYEGGFRINTETGELIRD